MHGCSRLALGLALALALCALTAAPAFGQADLRWYGTVTVSETASWTSPLSLDPPYWGGSGSYTIAFNGETADVYVAPDEYEQYQFDAHPVAAPTASVYAGTNTWEWTDPYENHYTCSTKGTYGAVSTAPGALLAEIQMPPAAAGSLSFWATFASNADPPGMTSSVAWETTGVTPADDVYCEHPSFDSESDREYIEGGPVGFLSKADVAFTRSDQGVVRASGTVAGATDNTGTWTLGGHQLVSQDVTVTVDLQGYPPGVKPDEEEPPPPTLKDPVVLRLVASKFPPGNGSLKAGGARCRGGDLSCSITVERGTTVRVVAEADTGSLTHGLYGCDQNLGLACNVRMTGPRTVNAYFGADPEILDPTLLDPDQKIYLAEQGAEAATQGAVGCAFGAVIIGTGGTAAAAEVALLGTTTASQVFTDCVKGALLTGALGMLLKVDPRDPDFRAVGYPEAMPGAKGKRCRLRRGCKELTRTARGMASTGRQSASLVEAAAVAGNRYGNAVTAGDARVQHVQRAAFTILLDLAADLDQQRAAQSRKLAKVVRKLGLRKLRVRVPKRVKVPAAALDRLVRKRLATDRADAKRLVRGVKPGRKRVDLLKTLRAAARTSAARAALADLPAADLPLLVLAIADQEGARSAGLDAGLQALASCDEGAATAARTALDSLAAKPALIAGRALDELARRAAQPGCAA